MESMNWIAGYIGWTVCILSGVAVTASLVGIITNYAWRKIKLAHELAEIQRAIKAYQKSAKTAAGTGVKGE
ncbi:hypothetical protein NLN82_26455 [Citrobacter portucalensis]|uniref:hypothetical protein n=1 Tax=Citrobacter portucalensis TaxID=1639133 RepID=UPI00226B8A29|nr:hypothetical protein [Citrobacter portucalensis]MCX9039549.1 hypothetical protein [Citrobacter portucalensis]